MTNDRRPQTADHGPETALSSLASHYSRFRVHERLLLTGHSHQAWPDVGFEAQQRAWLDAAEFVDDKWDRAAAQALLVREGFARLLGDSATNIALGQNTHELATRWLSALPWRSRRRLVTTDGEFHTIRRQLNRLREEGAEIVTVPARPADQLARRIAAAVDDHTLAVLVSSVLYETAAIVPHLEAVAAACVRHGAALLVDAYHHLNVVPFDIHGMGLSGAFVTGGGYKYCQLGEGNCFLRVPPNSAWRPVLTGWFAEFAALERDDANSGVAYGAGADAFIGATYDPTSHYRAAAVFAFHASQGLTAERLRDISVRQVSLLESSFAALDLDPRRGRAEPLTPEQRGGFLAIEVGDAPAVARELRRRGVFMDARGTTLRAGPAPYLSDAQLRGAVAALGEVLRAQP
jgi:kynureninase